MARDPRASAANGASTLSRVIHRLLAAGSSRPAGRGARILVAAPERIVLGAVMLALSAGLWVSVGQHHPWTVLPTAAVATALAWRLVPRPTAVDAAERTGALIALGGSAAWAVLNAVLSAEYLVVVRDPGFLTLSGLWLVDHPSTDIPALGAVDAAAVDGTVLADASEAWNLRGDAVQPQGAKMLPATIAIGGWIGGDRGVLVANVIIGAVGILAVYLLARRMLGPLAALAPAAAVAVSVSHIGLSRAAYSEPLTLLLLLAATVWLWRGIAERRVALIALGALTSGAISLIRIDGAAFALGLLVTGAVALALTDAPRGWRTGAGATLALLESAVLAGAYAALWRWSEAYAERLGDQADRIMLAYGTVATVTLIWVLTWAVRGDAVATGARTLLGRRGAAGLGIAVAGLLAVLASRPLWWESHRGTETSVDRFTNGVVESFQANQGLEVDPTRTYAEHTVAWVSYYLTWPLVLLGILGFGLATAWMLRKRPEWALLLGAALPTSLLYFWNPEVVPDQLWAFRRFEPATLPGFAIAAAVAAWWLASRLRGSASQRRARTAAAIGFVVLPLTTWISLKPGDEQPVSAAVPVFVREMGGARDQLADLCALAPGRPIILAGTSSHFGSLRVMCDQPTVLALAELEPEQVATMAQAWETAPVVLTRNPEWFEWTVEPSVVQRSSIRQASYSLQEIPRTYFDRSYEWYAGIVGDDGTLTPVEPQAGTVITSP